MKVCFVVQRYGLEVNGGAEAYARQVAEHMVALGGHEVHVATTKAIDYVTWNNEYTINEEELNGVTIHRFKVVRPRNQETFNRLSARVLTTPTSKAEQEIWMQRQGPESPELVDFVKNSHDIFDCFIFVCYLYYTTYFAMSHVKDKAIFIPTAHEERPIHLDIFADMFKWPAVFYYNTVEEKTLTNKLFDVKGKPDNDGKGGVGVELPSGIDADGFKSKYNLDNFMVYVGRIDENKCCPELFRYFAEYKKRNPNSTLKLVLMGKEIIEVPKRDDIVSLGFVSEEDKYSGIAASRFLVLPSKFESLSIVVLEAMALGKPVLVSGDCDVLAGHCVRSNAGLYYFGYLEFEACINYLVSHDLENKLMGQNGIEYVARDYSWPELIKGYERLMDKVIRRK